MKAHTIRIGLALFIGLASNDAAQAQTTPGSQIAPNLPPAYTLDLMTSEGMAPLRAEWRNMDAHIVEVPAMPDAGAAWTTAYDIDPHAGESGYDDSAWPVIAAEALAERRGGGRIFFTWYRTTLTIPENIGEFQPSGTRAVLHVLVDDYAEVWVNGELPRAPGSPSPAAIQGFNTANRILLSEEVQPGDSFEIAIFGINGTISLTPLNTVWFREARLEFIP
jgi:gluconolactonase